jgi:hypothetical protein
MQSNYLHPKYKMTVIICWLKNQLSTCAGRCLVLLHNLFASEEFHVIVERVQGGQIRESLNDNEEPSPLQSNWVKREVTKVLLPKLQRTQHCTQSLLLGQRVLAKRQDLLSKVNKGQSHLLHRMSRQLSLLCEHLGLDSDQDEHLCCTSVTMPPNLPI